MAPNPYNQPLKGVRVLDLSRIIAGPLTAMMLGDLGAEVVKVEPADGDEGRRYGTNLFAGNSALFYNYNRNKRSIVIDLRHPKGRDPALRLAARNDVLVENFRTGVVERRGLGYEDVRKVNPGIIYCSISGFGRTGPYAHRPAFEAIGQAIAGTMSINGEEGGKPQRVGPSIGDFTAGVLAALRIVTSLYARRDDGQSRYLDVSLLEGQLALMNHFVVEYFLSGNIPVPWGTTSQAQAPSRVFPTATDDLMIMVGEGSWKEFCRLLETEHLVADPRFATNPLRIANRHALEAEIIPALHKKSAEEWLALFVAHGIPCSPINNIAQVVADPQVIARQAIREATHPEYGDLRLVGPVGWRIWPTEDDPPMQAPPLLGEHTGEVLRDCLGLNDAEIAALREERVIQGRVDTP